MLLRFGGLSAARRATASFLAWCLLQALRGRFSSSISLFPSHVRTDELVDQLRRRAQEKHAK